MNDADLREQLAALAHEQWAGWMRYLFGFGYHNPDGSFVGCPLGVASQVQRWQRQMRTPYAELPESEKESDRIEADKVLAMMTGRS